MPTNGQNVRRRRQTTAGAMRRTRPRLRGSRDRARGTTDTEYDYGRRVEQVVAAPGGVTRLSIGVIVPGQHRISPRSNASRTWCAWPRASTRRAVTWSWCKVSMASGPRTRRAAVAADPLAAAWKPSSSGGRARRHGRVVATPVRGSRWYPLGWRGRRSLAAPDRLMRRCCRAVAPVARRTRALSADVRPLDAAGRRQGRAGRSVPHEHARNCWRGSRGSTRTTAPGC